LAAYPVNDKTEGNLCDMSGQDYQKPTEEELLGRLTPLQYFVTQQSGTERPFQNEFWDVDKPGIYVDIVTGEPLFSSRDKFHSSCGWPAFSEGLEKERIAELQDLTLGRVRTDVRSTGGDTHLGHVFKNDPESPNGVRYCINSASLRFIPLEEMEAAGYGYLIPEVKSGE
jgi:peptide methionine sulfoxide reductase msrA/msrB